MVTGVAMKAAIAKIRGPGRPRGRAMRSRRAPTWTPAQARGSNRLFAPQLDGVTRPNPRQGPQARERPRSGDQIAFGLDVDADASARAERARWPTASCRNAHVGPQRAIGFRAALQLQPSASSTNRTFRRVFRPVGVAAARPNRPRLVQSLASARSSIQ